MKPKLIIAALVAALCAVTTDAVRSRLKLRAHAAEMTKLNVLIEQTQKRVEASQAETERAMDSLERSVNKLQGSVAVWEARKRSMEGALEMAHAELAGEKAKVRALAARLNLDPENFDPISTKKVY